MKRRYFIIISLISLMINGFIATSQENGKTKSQLSVIDYRLINSNSPPEKVFLHLDRPDYNPGDTIWFKAYSWFGYDQLPDTVSKVLYVDLLDKTDTIIISHKKLLIQDGISNGEIGTGKNIAPGVYKLRAYTRWMQNPNAGDPFYKTITIKPVVRDLQVEFNPVIVRQAGNDSIRVSLRLLQPANDGSSYSDARHDMRYQLIVGTDTLKEGRFQLLNNRDRTYSYSLAGINKTDSVVVFKLASNDSSFRFYSKYKIPLRENLDVQFFPEGGNMVEGVGSQVAFIAIGGDGLSREVNGTVLDSVGTVVASFESKHNGMGAFLLKPLTGNKYVALVEYRGMQYKFPLPPALRVGYTLSVKYPVGSHSPYLTIKHGLAATSAIKYIAGSMNGEIRFAYHVLIEKDSTNIPIPMKLLNEGICRVTIMDSTYQPECERLFYVNKPQRFDIKVTPDSSSYKTRSKVTLSIKTTGINGWSPVPANLSITVVDKGQTMQDKDAGGISSYKLLKSDLRGYIEDPDWYFSSDSSNRYSALDLVLLTHGYRRFLTGVKIKDTLKYQPERDDKVSGRVELPGNRKYKKRNDYRNINLNLLLNGDTHFIGQSSPDSSGRFTFSVPLFFGTSVALSAPETREIIYLKVTLSLTTM